MQNQNRIYIKRNIVREFLSIYFEKLSLLWNLRNIYWNKYNLGITRKWGFGSQCGCSAFETCYSE
jgi:hypothetical protein